MKTVVTNLFINNWPRKLISLILAIGIWFVVDNTLTSVKTFTSVPVRIVNIPKGMTVEGMQMGGLMSKKVTLTMTGKKTLLERLSSNDLEVVIDAANRSKSEWVAPITRRNIVSLNSDVNIQKGISKVSQKNYIVRMSPLATAKVPIFITQPIGEAPRGYKFLDVWPYQLFLSVSGPEETVSKLKTRGVKLTFNLNDISKAELDNLQYNKKSKTKDVISYFIPKEWKQVYLPSISDKPLEIDDPDAHYLRIDFIRSESLPMGNSLPLSVFAPSNGALRTNIHQLKFAGSNISMSPTSTPLLNMSFYAKGVNETFIDVVRDMIQIEVIFPADNQGRLGWSVQFVNPKELEDRYVSRVLSDVSDKEIRELQPELRQKYLRNRFRNYMNRFQLFTTNDRILDLAFNLVGNQIVVSEVDEH